MQQLLVAIAISMVIQVILQMIYGPETRGVQSVLGSKYLIYGPFSSLTARSRHFRGGYLRRNSRIASTEEPMGQARFALWPTIPRAAEIVGANSRAVNTVAFAVSCCLAGIAGCVLVIYYPVNPSTGMALMPIALDRNRDRRARQHKGRLPRRHHLRRGATAHRRFLDPGPARRTTLRPASCLLCIFPLRPIRSKDRALRGTMDV